MTRNHPAPYPGRRERRRPAASARQPSLRFDSVSYSYGRLTAVDRVSFALQPGELAYLVGPSASGKTTLIRLAHGELRPASGELEVAGQPVTRARRGQLRRLRRQVGVVYQDYKLLARLTALENVAYALRVADLGLSAGDARRRAAEALDHVGLGPRAGAYPRQLSGGQQQRVAVARAVAAMPSVLLADEPGANLDVENAGRVTELLERLAGEGATVLIATCELDAAASARRVIRLAAGAVVEDCVGASGERRLRVLR
jgi:cell division transport system ATP-binding protein